MYQGDPAGNNNARLATTGIAVSYVPNTNTGASRLVTLRNLTVRNFARGAEISHVARVLIDNCRFENNLNYGILLDFSSVAVITNTEVSGTGFRTVGANVPNPGYGISLETSAHARVVDSVISHSSTAGVVNSGPAANLVFYKVGLYFNGTNINGAFTSTLEPNLSQN